MMAPRSPCPRGRSPICVPLLVGESVGHELPQPTLRARMRRVEDAQRRVPGAHQLARRTHDPLEDAGQREVAGQADDGLEQPLQAVAGVDDLADPPEDRLEQLVEVVSGHLTPFRRAGLRGSPGPWSSPG